MAGSNKRTPPSSKGQQTLFSFFKKGSAPSKPKANLTVSSLPSPTHGPQSSRDLATLSTPQKESDDISLQDLHVNSPQVSEEAAQPTLSTPESSSQPIPENNTPTRIGRRGKRKLIIADSDSEDEAALDNESGDDWEPDVKQEISEEEDEMIAEIASSDGEQSRTDELQVDSLSDVEDRKIPTIRKEKSPSSAKDSHLVLSKYSKTSEYIPSESFKSTGKHPVAKKVRVSEDPERYKWLLNIKDADGKSPDDPNYDPRTLLVPNSAWAKFTPFEKQYWEVKQKLWNTVVFFKKGKFYELYENDAEIAHRLFDLKLAGGGRANMSLCGVPEMSFDYWASAFIAKGYKVARVDQAETALGKEMRDIANKKKEEKIIRRELSCVLTGGTLTDATMLVSDLSQYCMAIKQEGLNFAACFVDTASSQFYISQFTDKSSDYPMLESLMAQVRPKELILARGNLDKFAQKILKNNTSVDTLWEIIKPDTEFWDADTARRIIKFEEYFQDGSYSVPDALKNALSNSELSASAVGGLVWYLRSLKLDKQLLSLGQFGEYDSNASFHGKTMVVDGQTLQNLEVFANTWDGGSDGTLFKLINRCVTPFGKRRLRSWIAHPLQRPEDISCRADAVDMFMAQDEVATVLSDRLVGLPDAERMLSRVHAGSLRPKDFVRLVGGLDSMANLLVWLFGLRSQLPQLEPFIGAHTTTAVTDLQGLIEPWMSSFDHVEAKTNDKIVPQVGVDLEFDRTSKAIKDIEEELKMKMKQYHSKFKSTSLEFRDSGKEIYLIEVPIKLTKQVPDDWQQMGATSKFKRYWSPSVRKLVRMLQEAQESHNANAQICQQRLYSQFCSPKNYQVFMDATRVISAIDCLLSLAKTSQTMAVHSRPEILPLESNGDATTPPLIEFTNLRHPVATSTDFIPNNVELGGQVSRLSLLTGANAAGKSTLLRTTCCAILLAQLGCHVPAETARLTPVDRIMTRLGASDNIFAGKSTFHLELAETERILSESTSRSFVVIDELGRGGSSSDGFAIAEAVLHHLATHVSCMGFFATHYATLYDSFLTHPQVKPERMAIDVDLDSRDVTFLYRLEEGRSEGSFGMNVASMCGVAPDIVKAAEIAAKLYEHTQMLKSKHNDGPSVPLGLISDALWSIRQSNIEKGALEIMLSMAAAT